MAMLWEHSPAGRGGLAAGGLVGSRSNEALSAARAAAGMLHRQLMDLRPEDRIADARRAVALLHEQLQQVRAASPGDAGSAPRKEMLRDAPRDFLVGGTRRGAGGLGGAGGQTTGGEQWSNGGRRGAANGRWGAGGSPQGHHGRWGAGGSSRSYDWRAGGSLQGQDDRFRGSGPPDGRDDGGAAAIRERMERAAQSARAINFKEEGRSGVGGESGAGGGAEAAAAAGSEAAEAESALGAQQQPYDCGAGEGAAACSEHVEEEAALRRDTARARALNRAAGARAGISAEVASSEAEGMLKPGASTGGAMHMREAAKMRHVIRADRKFGLVGADAGTAMAAAAVAGSVFSPAASGNGPIHDGNISEERRGAAEWYAECTSRWSPNQ